MTAREGRAPAWSWSLVGRAAFAAIVCFAAGSLAGYAVSHERTPGHGATRGATTQASSDAVAGSAETAFLAPVAAGTSLDAFSVEHVGAVRHGVLPIVCRGRGGTVHLSVALADPAAPRPAATAGRYAIYYRVDGATPREGEEVALALARLLGEAPGRGAPPGLGPFREETP